MAIMAGTEPDPRFDKDGNPKQIDTIPLTVLLPPPRPAKDPVSSPAALPDSYYLFEQDVSDVFAEAGALLLRKHLDYGAKNISGAPGGALNGLRVRMYDKLARINNLIDTGVEPSNESLRDSFVDMLNYAAIGMLVLDGDWPE